MSIHILRRSDRKACVQKEHDEWQVNDTLKRCLQLMIRLKHCDKLGMTTRDETALYYVPETRIPIHRIYLVKRIYKHMIDVLPYIYHKIETLQVNSNATYRKYQTMMRTAYTRGKRLIGQMMVSKTQNASVRICRNIVRKYCEKYEGMREIFWSCDLWRRPLPTVVLDAIESYLI